MRIKRSGVPTWLIQITPPIGLIFFLNTHISPIVGKDLVVVDVEHRDLVGAINKALVGFEVSDLAGYRVQGQVLIEHEVYPLVPSEHGVQPVVLAERRVQHEVQIGPVVTKKSVDIEPQTEAQTGIASTDHEEVAGTEDQVDPEGDLDQFGCKDQTEGQLQQHLHEVGAVGHTVERRLFEEHTDIVHSDVEHTNE